MNSANKNEKGQNFLQKMSILNKINDIKKNNQNDKINSVFWRFINFK